MRLDGTQSTRGGREATPTAPSPGSRGHDDAAHAVLALQRTAGNRAVQRLLQRKEVASDQQIIGPQDWTTLDRLWRTGRWQTACLTNLKAIDSSHYRRVVQRRDFYKWFYDYTMGLGYKTRWPLAAWIVANGAHQIADIHDLHPDANITLDLAGPELQGYMREGNQVIFDNVLPKLKRLIDGGPLTGRAALQWDMQTLAEEQTLVQPMYARMSADAYDQLNYIARKKRFAHAGAWWYDEDLVASERNVAGGRVPGFDEDSLHTISDRWRYGMKLGNEFTPGGTGFDPGTDAMPSVPASYTGGGEFSAVDWRSHLHQVDALLAGNATGDGKSIPLCQRLIAELRALGDRERNEVLDDSSPDGGAYSVKLAEWCDVGLDADTMDKLVTGAGASTPRSKAFMNAFKVHAAEVLARPPDDPYQYVGMP